MVNGGDADAARIDHGRKTASGYGAGHTSPCARQHYFGNFVSTRQSGMKQRRPLSYHSGAQTILALGTLPITCMGYARGSSIL